MSKTGSLVIRTGCLTCHARGLRCSPDNPDCQRHTSAEWQANRARSRRHLQQDRALSIAQHAKERAAIDRMDFCWTGTYQEKQSLHFFSVITAPELSGLLDTHFWQKLMLQTAQSDKAIRHAVAAIGASHERQLRQQSSRNNSETKELQLFALRQCNKAIQDLIRPSKELNQTGIMRAMTASVLFACFESLKGDPVDAIPHVLSSRRLLNQYKKNQNSRRRQPRQEAFPIQLEVIEPLVVHYEIQIGDHVNARDVNSTIRPFNLDDALEFNKIADARISLERGIASLGVVCLRLERQQGPEDIAGVVVDKAKHSAWLQSWEGALSAFLAGKSGDLTKAELEGYRLLKSHQLAASTLADVKYGLGEEAWSEFDSQYKAIVELIGAVLESIPKRRVSSQPPQTEYFSASMGMTEPLYCTVSRCRDEDIVKEARALLAKLPPSEGVHSSWRVSFIERTLCAATGKYFDSSNYETETSAKAT